MEIKISEIINLSTEYDYSNCSTCRFNTIYCNKINCAIVFLLTKLGYKIIYDLGDNKNE